MTTESTLPLSALTPAGIEEFRQLLASSPSSSVEDIKEKAREIAQNPKMATVLNEAVQVPVFPELGTRKDTADLATSLLSKATIDAGPAGGHEPMFSWLALVFLPALCSRTKQGNLDTGETVRYLLSKSSSDFYRHLVACPYWMLRRYGVNARIFLCQGACIMPDAVETIASRPILVNSEGVIQLIDRLYWDESTAAPKKGFTATEVIDRPPPGFAKKPPKPGTLRALEWTLGQLQCTHDLRSMTADQIVSHLPSEFAAWMNQSV